MRSAGSPFRKEYDYYKDGRLKFIKENFEQTYKKFDRLCTYDHQARIHEAKSGTEATGTTQTELLLLPYRQTYEHNVFGQITERESPTLESSFRRCRSLPLILNSPSI